MNTGHFDDGRLVYGNRVVPSECHLDTGVPGKGTLPHWGELRTMIEGLADRFNLVEWMGFDVCVTPDGPKLIEINSHSGSKYLQMFTPFMTDGYLGEYFRGKLNAIDALDSRGIKARNETVR